MSNAYTLIRNRYYNLTSKYSCFLSNIRECSFDKENNTYLIDDNYEPCVCVEKIRDRIFFSQGVCACDALYFCDRKQILLFIEFKNRHLNDYADTLVDKIAQQALDSLLTHYHICRLIKNNELVPLHFAATISFDKNNVSGNVIFNTMLQVSGELVGGDNSNDFNNMITGVIQDKISSDSRYSVVKHRYSFIGVVFSNKFNDFFNEYI